VEILRPILRSLKNFLFQFLKILINSIQIFRNFLQYFEKTNKWNRNDKFLKKIKKKRWFRTIIIEFEFVYISSVKTNSYAKTNAVNESDNRRFRKRKFNLKQYFGGSYFY
jgi:hypothetical protein